MVKKAVIYISEKSKEIEIKNFCKKNKFKIIEIFNDLSDMQTYLLNNQIDILIFNSINDLRLKVLIDLYFEILKPNQISIITIKENLRSYTKQGKNHLETLINFREKEKEFYREKTKNGRLKKGKNNKHAGGECPVGYIKNDDNVIKKDKLKVKTVKKIFKLYLKLKSIGKIKIELDKLKMKTKNNNSFSRQALNYILKNKVYTGVYSYDGIKEQNNIESKKVYPKIINVNDFNQVQKILTEKNKRKNSFCQLLY